MKVEGFICKVRMIFDRWLSNRWILDRRFSDRWFFNRWFSDRRFSDRRFSDQRFSDRWFSDRDRRIRDKKRGELERDLGKTRRCHIVGSRYVNTKRITLDWQICRLVEGSITRGDPILVRETGFFKALPRQPWIMQWPDLACQSDPRKNLDTTFWPHSDEGSGGISGPIGYPDRNGHQSYPEGLFAELASTWGQKVIVADSALYWKSSDPDRIDTDERRIRRKWDASQRSWRWRYSKS